MHLASNLKHASQSKNPTDAECIPYDKKSHLCHFYLISSISTHPSHPTPPHPPFSFRLLLKRSSWNKSVGQMELSTSIIFLTKNSLSKN